MCLAAPGVINEPVCLVLNVLEPLLVPEWNRRSSAPCENDCVRTGNLI